MDELVFRFSFICIGKMNHEISQGPGYGHTSDKGQQGERSPHPILRHWVAHLLLITQVEALESQADRVPGTMQILCTLASPVQPHSGGNINPAGNGIVFFLRVWIQSCSLICLISNHVLN